MTECWCGAALHTDEQGVIWCAADDDHEPFEAPVPVAVPA